LSVAAGHVFVPLAGNDERRIKPDGDIRSDASLADGTPRLSRIGVEGKLCMWKALETITDTYPALAALDLNALKERALGQRGRIEVKRLELAPLALMYPAAAATA